MYVNVIEHLAELERALGADSKTYKTACQAFRDHPNLRAYRDHTGVVMLCSTDTNKLVDGIDVLHRTDDAGSSLLVAPFVKAEGQRVYADPPFYTVGFRNPKGFGECPLADWQVLMEDAELSLEVIRKVKWYLAAHRPVDYDQVPD